MQKIEGITPNISFIISLNICFQCFKEPSHRDGSFEYPQHMFWLGNEEKIFNYAHYLLGIYE